MAVRVAIFEDKYAVREAISLLVNGTAGLELAGAFPNCNNVLQDIEKSKPDVVLMDIEMPGMDGIQAVALVKEKFPNLTVLMQTVFEDDDKIFDAICSGASGYLLKETAPAKLMESIIEAYQGGAPMSPSIAKKALRLFQELASTGATKKQELYGLSPREKEVLQWLVNGYSYKMIASACSISFDTVRAHIRNIYEKLHVASSTEAVAKALRERLV